MYLWPTSPTNKVEYSFGKFLCIQVYALGQFWPFVTNCGLLLPILVRTQIFEHPSIKKAYFCYLYSFGHFMTLQINSYIRSVNSLVSKYFCFINSWDSEFIRIFERSIFGHSNIFGYMFGPISWYSLITLRPAKLVYRGIYQTLTNHNYSYTVQCININQCNVKTTSSNNVQRIFKGPPPQC